MLTLIYGTDSKKRQETRDRILAEHTGADIMNRSASETTRGELEQVSGGMSLFGGKLVMVLEYPFDSESSGDLLIEMLPSLVESENIFIVLERELAKEITKTFEKVGADVFAFDEPKRVTKEFNVFSITDAFQARDKKKVWLLYREAVLNEHEPEEITGVLFWAIKNMLLLVDEKGSAGLSPFVAGKARSGLSKWNKSDLSNASRGLVDLMHAAHSGLAEFEEGLEQYLLKI